MTAAEEHSQHGHIFRPGPFRARRAYWLDGAVLHWRIGRRKGHLHLADIACLRLYLPEGGEAVTAHCLLVEKSGRRHRISDRYWFRWTAEERRRWGRHRRHTATFRGLAFTLARRLARANPAARLLAGPSRGEWIASCAVAACAVAVLAAGTALMIAEGGFHLAAAAFMGLALVQLPLLWPAIRTGGPRPLDPQGLHDAAPAPRPADG